MKELSLNVLDIAENSVKAGATLIGIRLVERGECLTLTVTDNGCGMTPDVLRRVTDPFCTSRTTRKVGLGIPFYKLAAEQTGGKFSIQSKTKEEGSSGTRVFATFIKSHIDCLPLGNITDTVITLVQGSPNIDFTFTHKFGDAEVHLSTRELREVLSNVPINTPEVLLWIEEYLKEQYSLLKN